MGGKKYKKGGERVDQGQPAQQQQGHGPPQQQGQRPQQQPQGPRPQQQPMGQGPSQQQGQRPQQQQGPRPQQQPMGQRPQPAQQLTPASSQSSLAESVSRMSVRSDQSGPSKQGSKQRQPAAPLALTTYKGPGTAGRKLGPIETNYVKIGIGNMVQKAYHYDVKFDPDAGKKSFPAAFKLFIDQFCPGVHIAFDGRCNAYAAKPLKAKEIKGKVTVVNKETGHSREYTVTMQAAANTEISLNLLKTYVKDGRSDELSRALQCFEIVMKSAFSQKHLETGVMAARSFYLRPERQPVYLGDYFELWLGLFQSTILGDMPFLNIDIAHKAFPKRYGSLVDLLDDMKQDFRIGRLVNVTRPLDEQVCFALSKHLAGMDIIYRKTPESTGLERKFLAVVDIPSRIVFEATRTVNGKEEKHKTNVQDYFKSIGTQIKYPHLPCIKMGNTIKSVTVPMEFCSVSDAQALNRKTTENQTRAIIKEAATSTDVRKQKILDMLAKIRHNNSPTIQGFGINIDTKFITVPARQLNAPMIEYSQNRCEPVQNGVWKIDRQQFLDAQTLEYAVLNFNFATQRNELVELCRNFSNYGRNLNMNMPPQPKFSRDIVDRNLPQQQKNMNNAMNEIAKDRSIRIVFCVIPGQNPKFYGKIKQAAELEYGVLTQCIKAITVQRKRGDGSTIVNLLLKVNAKLNGTNHKLQASPLLDGECMIIGADVTHPSPDQRDIPSVVGVAASHDRFAFKYNIDWRLQTGRVEIIQDFCAIIKKQLMYFKQKNGNFPKKIFYYRDGVSEGQFQFVMGEERQGIVQACQQVQPGYKPKLTLIIVQKRHHTRFFPGQTRIGAADRRNNNVPAGTIVDQVITSPKENNFFLCSHASIQGVAKPAKYCILMDEGNHTIDQLQTFTYDLCHLFTRCNRTVSYPAPTYYAHLVAFRGRVYIEDQRLNTNDLAREFQKRTIQKFIINDHPMFFV